MSNRTHSVFVAALLIFFGAAVVLAESDVVKNQDELKAAIGKAGPGDQIVMKDGTWSDITIRFKAKGSKGAPITLRAQTPGKVIINGRSSLKIEGEYLKVDGLVFKDGYPSTSKFISFGSSGKQSARHCRLTNTVIDDYNSPDLSKKFYWVSLYGAHNRVDHCLFSNMKNRGVTMTVWISDDDPPNYHRIDHNFFDRRAEGKGNGYETLRIGDSKRSMKNSRTTVEYNLFSQCDGEIEIISNKTCENRYLHNTFVNCKGMLTLRHGNRCLVEGNFFFGRGNKRMGGVRIIGQGHKVINNYFEDVGASGLRAAISLMNGVRNSKLNEYFQVKDCVIAFNTLVKTKCSISSGTNRKKKNAQLSPERTLIANNIVIGAKSPLIHYDGPAPAGITYENNILYGADLGIAKPKGILVQDPKLTKGKDGLWRPAAGSPAIGAAKGDFSFVKADMDGQPRTGRRTVGADEPSKAAVKIRPLTRKDVGPEWK